MGKRLAATVCLGMIFLGPMNGGEGSERERERKRESSEAFGSMLLSLKNSFSPMADAIREFHTK